MGAKFVFTDALTFEGRTKGHRDGHLGDDDFEAAHFDGFGADFLERHVADHVFVSTDTGWQHLGDVLVGDGGEAPVDGARRIGIPFIRDRGQRIHESKHAVFVVDQVFQSRPGFDTAEGHGGPAGEP